MFFIAVKDLDAFPPCPRCKSLQVERSWQENTIEPLEGYEFTANTPTYECLECEAHFGDVRMHMMELVAKEWISKAQNRTESNETKQ